MLFAIVHVDKEENDKGSQADGQCGRQGVNPDVPLPVGEEGED